MDRFPSAGERQIRTWLSLNNIRFEAEKEFPSLVNPKTGAPLRLDFWLPDYMIAIEYDGGHHLTANNKYHNNCKRSFASQKHRDTIKDKWAQKNAEKMIRIVCNKKDTMYRTLEKEILWHKAKPELASFPEHIESGQSTFGWVG